MPNGLVHLAAVAEAHFDLGRVHVDVDPRRVDLEIQRIHRLALAVQHVLVGAARGVGEHLVAHEAAVDVGELLVGPRSRRIRDAGKAHTRIACLPSCRMDPPRYSTGTLRPISSWPSTSASRWSRVPARHCSTSLPSCQMAKPTSGRASACRRTASMQWASSVASVLRNLRRAGVLKNSSLHLDGGAGGACGRPEFAAARIQQEGAGRAGRARQQAQLGNRGDRREGLAAESHRARPTRGRPATRSCWWRGAAAPAAVPRGRCRCRRPRPRSAARRRPSRRTATCAGARVERVVDQFAHHRSRPLDHFAGGDLADQFLRQFADCAARDGLEGGVHEAGL